jgi:hypothetical protein
MLAAPAEAAVDCTTDCVNVSVTPGLDRFTFVVNGTTSVKLNYKITSLDGTKTIATSYTPGYTTTTTLGVSSLPQQGQAYRYQVYGTDLAHNTWKETGYFTTLVRDLSVHFDTVQITDDGDSADAGEIVAAVQLWSQSSSNCARKALAPFSMTSTRTTSSGSPMTVGSTSDLACAGIGSPMSVQGHMADNDVDWWDDECGSRWPWHFYQGSFGAFVGGDDCADWNYSHTDLYDPLPALGTGTTTKAFTSTAFGGSFSTDWDTGPEWVLTGSAKWTHRKPAISLPATVGAPARFPLTIAPKQGGFSVSWSAPAMPGMAVQQYLVEWRKPGQANWTTLPVNAPATSASVAGLEGGTTYDVQVLAQDINGLRYLRSPATVTTQALAATNVGGWDTTAATLPAQSQVPFTATVSGDPRPVQLQVRRSGTESWTTMATYTSDAADQVSGSLTTRIGIDEWRLFAPQSGTFAAAASAVRTINAKTTIDGFVTTKVTKPAGSLVSDEVTVTPGAGREVLVQWRKSDSTTWTTYQTLVADGSGVATAQLKAFAGTTVWRIRTLKSAAHGALATTTAGRTVVGQ